MLRVPSFPLAPRRSGGPTSVQIEASESPLVEAREAELTCTAVGSNPPAHLTWYQQGKTIEDVYVNVSFPVASWISLSIYVSSTSVLSEEAFSLRGAIQNK